MCHLSHSYHSGACLYFTFAFVLDDADPLVEYDMVKCAIQQAFVDNGGTISHHHGVGTEHSRWMVRGHLRPRRGHDRRGVRRRRSRPELQPRQGHRELTVALRPVRATADGCRDGNGPSHGCRDRRVATAGVSPAGGRPFRHRCQVPPLGDPVRLLAQRGQHGPDGPTRGPIRSGQRLDEPAGPDPLHRHQHEAAAGVPLRRVTRQQRDALAARDQPLHQRQVRRPTDDPGG